METILLVATISALVGAYFVSKGMWQGFAIWIITNIVFASNNFYIGQWQQGILFSAYFVLAVQGFFNFKKLVN